MPRQVHRSESLSTRADGGLTLAVVADTHSAPHPRSFELIRALKPDAILHAGDIGELQVLEEFRALAPLIAVRGNIDNRADALPDVVTLSLESAGSTVLRLMLTHSRYSLGVNGTHAIGDLKTWNKPCVGVEMNESPMQYAAAALEALLEFIEKTPRTRSPQETVWSDTLPLVQLEFAWAFARVGQGAKCLALQTTALEVLQAIEPLEPPSWWFLHCAAAKRRRPREVWSERGRLRTLAVEMYTLRVAQALGGTPVALEDEAPWKAIETAADFDRYLLHQLVSVSRVLSPALAVNALSGFARAQKLNLDPYLSPHPRGVPSQEALTANRGTRARRDAEQQLLVHRASEGLPAVLEEGRHLREVWPRITDSLNSNVVWCLSVVQFVDSLVFAIAESVNPQLPAVPTNICP